jgi:glutamyl-tRNA synthetase
MSVRVRFAPSPTGHLHIGGARTALFNYLFARNQGGEFFLRIEDTDRERSTEEFLQSILKGMEWLGLEHDGDLTYQSKRTDSYKKHIEQLLDDGKAYRCYCTPEELTERREAAMKAGKKPKYDNRCRDRKDGPDQPAAIRIKAPLTGTTSYHDICRGKITVNNEELDDLIIARSDGSPTYNLTVVVDDVDMKITHVIRGDDHINNTTRQIVLYEAMNYPIPEFAHLPMIHGPDKKKLSKRHGAVSVIEYQDQGFLPEAMVNYLSRLGWSYGDQEIFTKNELIKHFNLAQVGNSPSVFDVEKLSWVNSQHMLKYNDSQLCGLVKPYLEKRGLTYTDSDFATKAIKSERERGRTLDELAEISAFYFQNEVIFDEKSVKKWLGEDGKKTLTMIKNGLEKLTDFTEDSIGSVFKKIMEESGQKMLKLAQPCRVALTGTTVSPGIYEVIAILGKEKTLKRFDRALNG